MPEAEARLAEYGLELSALTGCEARAYEAGESLVHVGAYIDNMLLITEGRAKVCRYAANGQSLVLSYASSGLMESLEVLCRMENATATVAAMTDLVCVAVLWRVNEAYLRGNPAFLNALCRGLAENCSTRTRMFPPRASVPVRDGSAPIFWSFPTRGCSASC